MFGGLLALLSAVTFAITNASVRRGVISGSAVQATTLSIPVGVNGTSPGIYGDDPIRTCLASIITP